jgi:single-strand DNA-binding protein
MSKGTLNKAILIGRLGKDAELRYTVNGTAIASFSVATNETFKDKEGKPVEQTYWHKVVAWGKLAEICGQYLKKGGHVCIEGSMKTRSYEDKSGVKRTVTEIVAESMKMLGPKSDSEKTEVSTSASETEIHDEADAVTA